MTESAELARRLGVRLHTHLAETLDEERSCLQRFGKRPLAVLDDAGLDRAGRLGGPRHPLRRRRGGPAGGDRHGRRALPVEQLPAGLGHLPGHRPGRRRCAGRPRGGRGRVERDRRAAARAADGAVPGPAARSGPDRFVPADALRLATEGGARCLGRDDVGRLEPGCGPTSSCGRATTSPTCSTRSPASCSVRSAPRGTSSSRVTTSCGTVRSSAPTWWRCAPS